MKIILLLSLLSILVFTQTPPVWPVRFQQDFVQSFTKTQFRDAGKFWFDSARGAQRMDRGNGKYNDICGSISNATTPCTHLVHEGKRYIVFPLLRQCCFCCDSAHGCGVFRRDWLSGSTFAGKEDISGQTFNKYVFQKEDIQFWTTTDAKQIPRKMIEDKAVIKDFIMNTYSEEYIAESIFALPSYCSDTNLCPASSPCGEARD